MKLKATIFLLALFLAGCGSGEPLGNPICGSSANPTSGDTPLTVQFTENAEGSIVQYLWDFGDFTPPSQQENPEHEYNLLNPSLGQNFSAVLTVVGLNSSVIECAPITITVNPAS